MIDTAVSLIVIAVLVAGVSLLIGNLNEKSRQSDLISQINELQSITRAVLQNARDVRAVGANSPGSYISDVIVAADMIDASSVRGGKIVTPGGKELTIMAETASACPNCGNAVRMEFETSSQTCIALANADFGRAHVLMRVQPASGAIHTLSTTSTVSDAVTYCGEGDVTMRLSFAM